MAFGWSRFTALSAVGGCALTCACSSTAKPKPSATPSTTVVATYLDAVNALCDALLPKVIAVSHGGNLDIPVQDYLAQQPGHAKLLSDFDQQLARVSVPPDAAAAKKVLDAYIAFANRLDSARLTAANKGAVAYADEIRSEAGAASDPAVVALTGAGFHDSCQAR